MDTSVLLSSAIDLMNRAAPFMLGALTSTIGLILLRKSRKISSRQRSAMGDKLLVETAIEEVQGEKPKETYLRVTVLMELERLTAAYTRADRIRVILGSIYLGTGFISIAITGTNASLPGIADTVKFSFAVNIVGEIASGFLIFGGFESRATLALQTAGLIRLELGQFIAQSAEYYQQDASQRWFNFTQSIENLLLRTITPAEKPSKQEAQSEEDATEEEGS